MQEEWEANYLIYYHLTVLLKKLVQLGCISNGFLCGSHQPKVLIHLTVVNNVHFYIIAAGLSEEGFIHCLSRYESYM